MYSRETLIKQIQENSKWDVIVIGGGATGLGLALDSAARGYKTLLLGQVDFSKGTSSKSTKLVHGGVRYLAQGNIDLVIEALYERGLLWRNALHLVRNQSFIIPNYNWWDNFFYAVGLKVYDILVGKLSFVKCIRINKKETISGLKTIKNPQLKGGVVYHNGQFDDARLVINIAQTCIETGAVVLNHFKVEQLINKTIGDNGGWIVVTVGWALGVYVAVVLAGAYSGANVNHAVSIGLAIACEFPWESIPKYILAQMLGAMLVAIIVWLFYKDHFDATKKAVFCTAPAIINLSFNLFNEIVGTVVLVFSILCFTNPSFNDLQSAIGLGFLGALPVAFLVWAIGFSFGGITGHVINPLRNLGPRIIHAMLPIKDKSANDWSHS